MSKVCEMCGKKQATVLYKQTVNGVTTVKNLCPDCYRKFMKANSIGDLIKPSNLFASFFSPEGKTAAGRVCKTCGLTERELLESGNFGCSDCYSVFNDIAAKYASQLSGTPHRGKFPYGRADRPVKSKAAESAESIVNGGEETEIEKLKRELRTAVNEERYEDASVIQKKIKALEGKGNV